MANTGQCVGTINNLWGIGIRLADAFDTNALYFMAGIDMRNDGLFGEIQNRVRSR